MPESVADPLAYYLGNTVKCRALIETAVQQRREELHLLVDRDHLRQRRRRPASRGSACPAPINPYGRTKLMTEWMLEDAARAHGLRYAVLRYFNVAGADPQGRSGQSTPEATHLIKVAAQAALGQRPISRSSAPTTRHADGTCVRDYIQVNDLARAHLAALDHLRRGGESGVMNCGYGHGSLGPRGDRGREAGFRRRFRGPARTAPSRRSGDPRRPGRTASGSARLRRRNSTILPPSPIRPCAGRPPRLSTGGLRIVTHKSKTAATPSSSELVNFSGEGRGFASPRLRGEGCRRRASLRSEARVRGRSRTRPCVAEGRLFRRRPLTPASLRSACFGRRPKPSPRKRGEADPRLSPENLHALR